MSSSVYNPEKIAPDARRQHDSQDDRAVRLGALACVVLRIAMVGVPLCVLPAEASSKCLSPTDPVAGILRKVTIRHVESRELITNWHIVLSEPVCVKTGDVTWSNQLDVQIVFAKSVDLLKVDEALGEPFGVKGHIVGFRDARDTADIIVTDAELYGDLDDAGEIRRK